jgi:hypothetical protein
LAQRVQTAFNIHFHFLKKLFMPLVKFALCAVLLALLSACGGGSTGFAPVVTGVKPQTLK